MLHYYEIQKGNKAINAEMWSTKKN